MMEQENNSIPEVSADQLIVLFARLTCDPRINVWHIGLYMSLVYLSQCSNGANPVAITRKSVMQLSHISSIATYHKCIRQLQCYGYIRYTPSYNHYNKTMVELA